MSSLVTEVEESQTSGIQKLDRVSVTTCLVSPQPDECNVPRDPLSPPPRLRPSPPPPPSITLIFWCEERGLSYELHRLGEVHQQSDGKMTGRLLARGSTSTAVLSCYY